MALGFSSGCCREVGLLLRSLTSSKPMGRVAESGTGVGIGTAWMHSGLGDAASLVTVEREARLAHFAAELFSDDHRVQVLHGDWTQILGMAPFDVFFCDGGGKRDDPDAVISALSPGGVLVLDDFQHSPTWPPHADGHVDELRMTYLEDPRLVTCQVRVTDAMVVVLGVRRA